MNPIQWSFKADSTDPDIWCGMAEFTVGDASISVRVDSFGQGVKIFDQLERAYRLGGQDRARAGDEWECPPCNAKWNAIEKEEWERKQQT